MLRKKPVTFSEGLNILGFDDNPSNSAKESSPNEKSNDSSEGVSAHESSTSKKIAQHVVSRVYMAPDEVFEQDHVIDRKLSTHQTQN